MVVLDTVLCQDRRHRPGPKTAHYYHSPVLENGKWKMSGPNIEENFEKKLPVIIGTFAP